MELDIQVNDKLTIKERFDWPLADLNVSPTEFIQLFCQELELSALNQQKMKIQLLSQLLEYTLSNQNINKSRQKVQEEEVEQQPIVLKQNIFNSEAQVEEKSGNAPSGHGAGGQQMDLETPDKDNAAGVGAVAKPEEPEEFRISTRRRAESKRTIIQTQYFIPTRSHYFKDKKTCKHC